jgi:hypothetical protein
VDAPLGTEAVCHLAEGDAGPERLLGAVIGRRDGPVGEEYEQVSPGTRFEQAQNQPRRRDPGPNFTSGSPVLRADRPMLLMHCLMFG